MKKIEKYKNWILAFAFIVAVLAVYKTFDNFHKVKEFIKTIISSLTPFIVGFSIAYILNIPCKVINNACKKSKIKFINKGSKVISITSVYIILALTVYICISAVAPKVYENLSDLYVKIPDYVTQVMNAIQNFQVEHGVEFFSFDREGMIIAFQKVFGNFDVSSLSKYAQGVIDVTANVVKVFVGIIVSVYMLIEKDKIKAAIKRFLRVVLKENRSNKIIETINKINKIFSKYLFCLLLDAIIMTVLTTTALSLIGVKYAIILGIMIGLFNLIPYFGAITAVAIAIITTFLTGGFMQALWVALALIVIQQIDGNFIGPKIMGDMLNASPLLIILAVTLGGGLFGIVGMIVSVPIFIAIKLALTQYLDVKEEINMAKTKKLEEEKNSEE